MKSVIVLGSTGSVGRQALDVLKELDHSFRVVGLSGHSNHDLLLEQARKFHPAATAVASDSAEIPASVRQGIADAGSTLLSGPGSPADMVKKLHPRIVLQAVTGAAGLPASIAAVEEGARLALANKESLVMAGHLLMPLARKKGVEIVPVDSEHSAVYQALRGESANSIRRILLTASGGPFIDTDSRDLKNVTPEQALNHPNWDMGNKITIDSATMMNKALELIEACWLFDCDPDCVEIVVHRQSIVHSMVEFADGSIIAQMGVPDMKVPIRYALTCPERPEGSKTYFDFDRWSRLTFERPDRSRFPAIDLGYRAAREGGLSGTVLNAANEAAVELFLGGRIPFDEISQTVAKVLDHAKNREKPTIEEILDADARAREETVKCI